MEKVGPCRNHAGFRHAPALGLRWITKHHVGFYTTTTYITTGRIYDASVSMASVVAAASGVVLSKSSTSDVRQ